MACPARKMTLSFVAGSPIAEKEGRFEVKAMGGKHRSCTTLSVPLEGPYIKGTAVPVLLVRELEVEKEINKFDKKRRRKKEEAKTSKK